MVVTTVVVETFVLDCKELVLVTRPITGIDKHTQLDKLLLRHSTRMKIVRVKHLLLVPCPNLNSLNGFSLLFDHHFNPTLRYMSPLRCKNRCYDMKKSFISTQLLLVKTNSLRLSLK